MDEEMQLNLCFLSTCVLNCLVILHFYMRRLAAIRRHRARALICFQVSWNARRRIILSRRLSMIRHVMRLAPLYSQRRWWVFPRRTYWWQRFVSAVWTDEQWIENFRMPRRKFLWILERLRPRLERELTRLRRPISPEERLAVGLWFLANSTTYRLVGQQFGLARSTVAVIVIDVCLAMEHALLRVVVRPGPPAEAMMGFETIGFPHCIGAMDGTHIYIRRPVADADAYVNRKKRHSVVVQATVNHKGLFTDVAVGNVGRDHDAHVLRCSNIFNAMDTGVWVPGNPTITVSGTSIPALIVADSAYPTRSWLMTPHGGNLSPAQMFFNRKLSRARCVVERAFGRLKGRWRCILDKLYVMEENINSVICSCIILHNICELQNFPPSEAAELDFSIPRIHESPQVIDARQQKAGEQIRDVLTDMLFRQRQR